MTAKKYNLVPILEGYEKDPGKDLVIEIEIRNISPSVFQEIFKSDLIEGGILITKEYEAILYEKLGFTINTNKLDFFIDLYSD